MVVDISDFHIIMILFWYYHIKFTVRLWDFDFFMILFCYYQKIDDISDFDIMILFWYYQMIVDKSFVCQPDISTTIW